MSVISEGAAAAGTGVERPKIDGDRPRRVGRWALVPAVALAAGAQGPLLGEAETLVGALSTWAVVAPLVVGAVTLVVARWRFGEVRRGGGVGFGRLAWTGAAVLTASAVALRSPVIAAAAFLVTCIAAIDAMAGSAVRRAVFPAWLCVWLAVPFAFGGDHLFDLLHAGAVRQASAALDLLDVRHRVTEAVMEIPGRAFPTARPGGVLWASLAATCLLSVVLRRGAIWSGVLLLLTPVWVFGFQMVAVALPVYLVATRGGPDLAEWPSWWQLAAGIGVATALNWSADRGLSWLMPHGGRATWRMIRAFLHGGAGVEDRELPAAIERARTKVTWVGAIVLTAVFAAAAGVWLLPPLGEASNGAAGDGPREAGKDVDGPH